CPWPRPPAGPSRSSPPGGGRRRGPAAPPGRAAWSWPEASGGLRALLVLLAAAAFVGDVLPEARDHRVDPLAGNAGEAQHLGVGVLFLGRLLQRRQLLLAGVGVEGVDLVEA